jgi:non-ribosomal peptide synthetase component F
MGLADGQIAAKLGLTREQVMFIRNSEESRRFRTGQTAYLLDLGGGKRYRPERVVRLEDRFSYSETHCALRAALKFDAEQARRYIEQGWWGDDTLPRWLARHAKERPDAPAVVSGEIISWKALEERVLHFAEGLRRAGVVPGEVVAVQLPNTPEFIVAFLAICRLGAVMCTVHMPYRGAEIAALLRHSRACLAICTPQAKEMFGGIGKAFSEIDTTEMLAKDFPEPVAADPFLLLYTSGTTAAPKGVPHSYHTMLSNARLGVPEHRLSAADRILSAAPFTHLFGLYALHCAWSCGAASVLLPAFKPDELAAVVEKQKPTGLWTAPAHIAAVRAQGLFDKHDWSSLKLAIMSGSACPPPLVREFSERVKGCAVTQLWGMTETQGALYTRPGDALDVHCSSAGRPSPGTEVRIVDGELQVRGCLLLSRLLRQRRGERRRLHRRRLVPNRRPRRGRRRGQLLDHRAGEGRHQPRRRQVQSARRGGPARFASEDPAVGDRADARSDPRRKGLCASLFFESRDPVRLEELTEYLIGKTSPKKNCRSAWS